GRIEVGDEEALEASNPCLIVQAGGLPGASRAAIAPRGLSSRQGAGKSSYQGHVSLYRRSWRFIPGNFRTRDPVFRAVGQSGLLYFNDPGKEKQMTSAIDRRQFLQLAGLGSIGVVFGSALPGLAHAAGQDDFYFVQLSDTHWGFEGAPNPDAKGTLKKAVA